MTTRAHSGRIPATVGALSLVATLTFGAAGCSDDTVDTASTDAPATAAPSTPDPVQIDPVQIDVAIGVDSGDDRVEHVPQGADVTLNITNGPEAAEFHVHGIDLEVAAEPDQMVTLNFVASVDGPYEVENHETGAVILVIEVDQ